MNWLYYGNDLELRPFCDPIKIELAINRNILNYVVNNVTVGVSELCGETLPNKYMLSINDEEVKREFYHECQAEGEMESLQGIAEQTEYANLLKVSKIIKQRKSAPQKKQAYERLKVEPDFLKDIMNSREVLLRARRDGYLTEPFGLFLMRSRSLAKSLQVLGLCLSWRTSKWRHFHATLPELVGKVQAVLELQASPHTLIQAHSL